MSKPRVAFFDFACCEGCQLEALNFGPEFLNLIELIDIVNFREAISDDRWDFDIAFIEGSCTRNSDIPRLQKIRDQAKVVIALGACSSIAGVNAIKNLQPLDEVKSYVYGDKKDWIDTAEARPIDQVIKVDGHIPGCPIDRKDFIRTVQALLLGKKIPDHEYPVCLECRLKENECLLTLGKPCMGPITKGGCDAIEPTYGQPCNGCRGLVDDPNIVSCQEMLKKHNLSVDDVKNYFTIFNSYRKEGKNA